MKIIPAFSIVLLIVANLSLAQSQRTGTPQNSQIFPADSLRVNSAVSNSLDDDRVFNHLTIISDSRIHDLMDIQRERIERIGGINGYRVQIYQGNKAEAYQLKSKFLRKYSGHEVYVMFQTPDFRVRIGDFKHKSDALKLKNIIEKDFPNPYIVDDIINFPSLEEGKGE